MNDLDGLIAEARKCAPGDDATKLAVIVHRLADALEAATREPSEDDREAIARALCEGADTCWDDLTEQELVWHYRDADSVLAAGFSRATVPDAATAAVERVRAAKREVDSVHHIHGADCLCGFSSARSRSRTEHITEAMLAALGGAPEPEVKS